MRKLVFFVGPAGAGKTTLAQALCRKRRGALFDMDILLRPAAEAIMKMLELDPLDRDSPEYKTHCRDLGYRITMDAALDNIAQGIDAYVVGPFTKELEDPKWLVQELAKIGATLSDVEVKAIYVYLPEEEQYRMRLKERGSVLDDWKLEHWPQFRSSLTPKRIAWDLPANSILYWNNSSPPSTETISEIERFVYPD
ncbi:AAA family ATPase [Paenibacillus chartarius]|uniref:AAA family ATPase n=1 Tax=Paenibacillus chartarius TaxID=747481 RepID=A0ABV6DQQ7_9BACL